MLNIFDGESSANTARRSAIPGEQFPWREALIDGPAPSGVEGDEWRHLRAKHLSEHYGLDRQECENKLVEQERKLAGFREHDEVILWFDHDLFCQANLLYALDWFSRQDLGATTLSLISIGEFSGIADFRGLGQLTVEQLESLFPTRRRVAESEFGLARNAWQAYRSGDPRDLETLLDNETSALPFVSPAFKLHLARFPSARNGLGRIENRALEFVSAGAQKFIDLFPKFGTAEPTYGLGDFQFWLALKRLTNARAPLLIVKDGSHDSTRLSSEAIREAVFEITQTGERVIRGEADFIDLNGIDLWLGGVHLNEKTNLWRWDDERRTIVSG